MTKTHKGTKAQREAARRGVAPQPTGATAVRATPTMPAWLTLGSLLLAAAATLVSAYLTYEHFTASATLACPEGQTINCQRVTESTYSMLLGIPVALLGLLWCLAVLALCLPQAWRSPRLDLPRLALVGVGVAFVLYLVWAELFGIGAICLWCTGVHVLTALLLVLLLLGWALHPRR